MLSILKSDFYRFAKNKLFYALIVLTSIIAFGLIMLIRQDIRFGVSILGNLTAFKKTEDIIQIGLEYHKGLGIFIALLISVFIGQEYQWKTWQHKFLTNKNRIYIYLSKLILSSIASISVFMTFEMVALLSSNQIRDILTGEYTVMIICGIFIYSALGATICLLSMLIKNITTSTIACLCYVIFSETFVSVLRSISSFSTDLEKLVELAIQYSIYGMSLLVSEAFITINIIVFVIINSLLIMLLSTVIGLIIFRKYEL